MLYKKDLVQACYTLLPEHGYTITKDKLDFGNFIAEKDGEEYVVGVCNLTKKYPKITDKRLRLTLIATDAECKDLFGKPAERMYNMVMFYKTAEKTGEVTLKHNRVIVTEFPVDEELRNKYFWIHFISVNE